jgi:hypothetical protein
MLKHQLKPGLAQAGDGFEEALMCLTRYKRVAWIFGCEQGINEMILLVEYKCLSFATQDSKHAMAKD